MERDLMQDAERIEELTEGRIPFDRACWIALYITRLTSGMSHEEAIRMEEKEHAERGQPSPYDHGTAKAILSEMEQPANDDDNAPLHDCEECGHAELDHYEPGNRCHFNEQTATPCMCQQYIPAP